jgi:hypothetical protein
MVSIHLILSKKLKKSTLKYNKITYHEIPSFFSITNPISQKSLLQNGVREIKANTDILLNFFLSN